MSNTKTGGPAFPFPAYTSPNGEINHGEGGASLRDYFAAKAMQAFIAKYSHEGDVSRHAYKVANAMLEARNAAQ
jgi:hypothetical protein